MSAQIIDRTQAGFTIQVTIPYNHSMLEFEETLQDQLNAAGALATQEGLRRFDTDGSPNARYVDGYGYVEIGDQEGSGFVVRAIGHGGLDFEDDTPETLAEAMAVLVAGLARWLEGQGVELD